MLLNYGVHGDNCVRDYCLILHSKTMWSYRERAIVLSTFKGYYRKSIVLH